MVQFFQTNFYLFLCKTGEIQPQTRYADKCGASTEVCCCNVCVLCFVCCLLKRNSVQDALLRQFQKEIDELRKRLAEQDGSEDEGDDDESEEEVMGEDGVIIRRKSRYMSSVSSRTVVRGRWGAKVFLPQSVFMPQKQSF